MSGIASSTPIPSIINFEDAPGIAASEIPSLKMLFNADSADGVSNVLTDVVGGLTMTAANAIIFSQGTHGYITSGATGAMSALVGTLPAIGTKNFVQFGRWVNSGGGGSANLFDYGNYRNGGAFDKVANSMSAASLCEAYDGAGWMGHLTAAVAATYASVPIYIAVVCQPAATSSYYICTPEGFDITPDDTGGTANLTAGIGPDNNELFIPEVTAVSQEGGPMGIMILDGTVPPLGVIQRGLQWMTTNGATLLPPMWKGMA